MTKSSSTCLIRLLTVTALAVAELSSAFAWTTTTSSSKLPTTTRMTEQQNCRRSFAILPSHHFSSCSKSGFSTRLYQAAFFEDPLEEECDSEQECEIDWDTMMPISTPPPEEAQPSEQAQQEQQQQQQEQNQNYMTMGSQFQDQVEKFQARMEVNWQIDECETDHDSCEDFCEDCVGTGKQVCRFCRGTRMLNLDGNFRACTLCQEDGKVDCESCRGTGFIAPWAQTMDDFYHHPHTSEEEEEQEQKHA